MTKLLSTNYKTSLAKQLQESVAAANNSYYFFMGVHGNIIGDVPIPEDTTRELVIDAYRNMVQGKLVTNNQVSLVVRKVPYVENQVYDKYDDTDDTLFSKDFFVYVDEGAFIHVYKCLDNNFEANSTVQPDFAFVSNTSNFVFETSDGYVWKYLYTVTDTTANTFTTPTYFPLTPNTVVSDQAIPGSIDVVHIEQNDPTIPGGGRRYDNYVSGTFATNQLRINGNNFLYAISNDNIDYTAGFYTGCLIYLSNGIGVGQYATVIDYFTNANGNFIVIDDQFTINPENGTEFEIYPKVIFTGSGEETVNAVARALVNATGSNSIFKIEMLEKGRDYAYVVANVAANTVITDDALFQPVEIRPILPPTGGHGANVPEELGVHAIEFTMAFANSESNTLLIENRFQQVGLLKNPRFANVNIELANNIGTFGNSDVVFKISPLRVEDSIYISTTSSAIIGETYILANAAVVSSGTNGTYIPTDILDIDGGVYNSIAQLKIETTEVREAVINNAGSGYTPGVFSANLNVGTATTNATFDVTVNSTGFCESIVITNPGVYTANPPFLANSTPVGGAGTGLTVWVKMGLDAVSIYRVGSYAVLPDNLVDNVPIANTSNGVGAEVIISFTQTHAGDFLSQVDVGDYVYFSNPEETQQQLAVVGSVVNDTYMTITTSGLFTCAAAQMFLPRETTTAVVDLANSTNILLSNVDGRILTGDLLVSLTSSAKTQANAIMLNDVSKSMSSFIQLHKYDINVLSGLFDENEIVFQGASLEEADATALLHSIVEDADFNMYTSNQMGSFVIGTNIQGANSLALASINTLYSPELEFGSGSVLYLENIEPVDRAIDKSEHLQIVLEF